MHQEANCRPIVASFWTEADISDIFDMRLLLEPAAAASAAQQMIESPWKSCLTNATSCDVHRSPLIL